MQLRTRQYQAGERHPQHRDRAPRLSFLLRGSFAEDCGRGSIVAQAGDLLIKGDFVGHENRFGPEGALIATVELSDGLAEADFLRNSWRLRRNATAFRDGLKLLEAACERRRNRLFASVISAIGEFEPDEPTQKTPPVWINRLKDELETKGLVDIDIAARAREAGVHPVHASKLFRRYFRTSITDYARYHGVRRAAMLLDQKSAGLREIALEAGFYDQSHMTRSFKRVTGRTPGAYLKVSAGVGAPRG